MTKFSLGLILLLLVIGIVINVWQGGAANLITVLGYAPLGLYLGWIGISALIASRR
jgi:hypothetical protein